MEAEDNLRRRDLYADFVAAATQVMSGWLDYLENPPASVPEAEKLDAERAESYRNLDPLTARVRITTTGEVLAKEEEMMDVLREVQTRVRQERQGIGRAQGSGPSMEAKFADARALFVEAVREFGYR